MNGVLNRPVTAVIVGLGHRGMEDLGGYALVRPDRLKIVGVADPNELRREMAIEKFGLSREFCFQSAEELAKHPVIADAVINGTMDKDHVPTTIPLLKAGYDILLEKPIGTSIAELLQLQEVVKATNRKVMVCHELRYTPFYTEIRKRVATGEIGTVVNIQTSEHVSYHHMSVGYVRGKWNRSDICNSSMLMAKSCHDLDLIAWMKSGIPPKSVASFGGLMHFRPENAPAGAGTRCLADCPIESTCTYSARKLHIDEPERWSMYVWSSIQHIENPSIEDKIHSLKTDNPHGRCIWKCDNNVVDHQSVLIQFTDGSTATHNMIGGSSIPYRYIHILGTKGEIEGELHSGRFVVRHPDPGPNQSYSEEKYDVNVKNEMHGGGDRRLVEDFVCFIKGEATSISRTSLSDSINGHLIGFNADISMNEKRIKEL